MKPIQSTLIHRVLFPENSTVQKHPTVIMLHGRGSDEEDLLGIAPKFDERFLIISVRAPYQFPFGGYTWFDLEQISSPDLFTFGESYRKLCLFLDDVRAGYPVNTSALILFGFSMGTVMSYALGLTRPDIIRAVAANSGILPEVSSLNYRWQELANTEFFITHGTADPVIPIDYARRARDLMTHSGARFTYREYPMPHTLGDEALADVLEWTRKFIV
jgi:phospholipase/carboxylesterase